MWNWTAEFDRTGGVEIFMVGMLWFWPKYPPIRGNVSSWSNLVTEIMWVAPLGLTATKWLVAMLSNLSLFLFIKTLYRYRIINTFCFLPVFIWRGAVKNMPVSYKLYIYFTRWMNNMCCCYLLGDSLANIMQKIPVDNLNIRGYTLVYFFTSFHWLVENLIDVSVAVYRLPWTTSIEFNSFSFIFWLKTISLKNFVTVAITLV